MKQFRLLFTLLTLLAVGSMNTWAKTETITLTYSSFGLTSSYAEKTATINNFGFIVNQGYKGTAGGGCIQMNSKKGSGILYNTTPISGLKSVIVNVAQTGKTYTISTGTTSQPTTQAGTGTTTSTINVKNSGDSYFQLKVSGVCYFSSIVITYETGGSTPTYTVTYDANGGAVSPASDSYTNTPINLPTPTIEGCYLFDGWYTAKTGGTKVQSPYTPTANITLYAQWTASTATYRATINQPDATTNCRVKISKDGTTGVENSYDDIACGTTIHLLGTPSNGYKGFTYTAKDDNVTITPNGLNNASFIMPASSVEITATPIPCDAMDAPVVTYTSASNSLTFSWKPITGATNYNLYLFYNADGSSHSNDDMANTTECSYTFSNLEIGHTYAISYRHKVPSVLATLKLMAQP